MKTLENYKFETNTNPGENLLGFIQGYIRQYIIPNGSLNQLFNISLYTQREVSLFQYSTSEIHFVLTPKVRVYHSILESICKEIMDAINEEIFDGFLDAEVKDNVITYSTGPVNGSAMVGVITEELSFTLC